MDIADIATDEYVGIDANERLGKVRAIFEANDPKGLLVTDDGEYSGLVTKRDLVRSHVDDSAKVGALERAAPTVERTADVREVARVMVESKTKVAPVFEADHLWGVVTGDAILAAVRENLDALSVADVYTTNTVTVDEETPLGTAINLLREHGISRLPVTAERGALAGVVTTHDVVDVVVRGPEKSTRGERAGDVERVLDIPVYDLMSSPVATAGTGDSLGSAVERMLENDYGGLVITPTEDDEDRSVDGILTKTDVLRALTFTDEDHLDVQISNITLLDTLSREDVRVGVEEVADKYQQMQVQHAHVRFQDHKESLRGTPLVQCQIRLRTNRGQAAGSGEGFGAEAAFNVALDKLERNVLELKGVIADEEYRGQLLRKLGEL
ncbi:MAG: CBS domain-containing protein [Haloarculaceae archaeon]